MTTKSTADYPGELSRTPFVNASISATSRSKTWRSIAHELLKAETLARAWTPFLSNAGQPLAHDLGWFVADHHYQVGEDITNDVFTCAFLNVFVPDVANRADAQASPADIPSTGPAKDCEVSSRAALEKWIADRHAKARKAIPLDSKLAAAYAGRYQLPHRVVTVTEESGRLYIDVPQGDRTELFAETPSQFFLKIRPTWTLTFVKEGSQVIRLDFLESGEVISGRRID